MGVDLGVYDKQKTLADYGNARQQMADQAQQLYQQGQLANIDVQTKKNLYATQLLSGAVDQNSYDMIKQHLNQGGIQTTGLAPDFETGKQQIYQSRLAQSPLGSLLNAGLKAEGTLNQGASTFGNLAAATQADPLSASIARGMGGMLGAPQGAAIPSIPAGLPQERAVASDGPKAPSSLPPPFPVQTAAATASQFTPPPQQQGESAAAYQNRAQMLFNAWKENPEVMRAQKSSEAAGGKEGEHIGEAGKTLDIMQSNLPSVMQRFQAMREASANASSGMGVNNEGDGFAQQWANTSMGNDATSKANNILEQRAAQGILPELGPQLAQAGVKGNKFLETIANSASGLNMSAKPQDKVALIDGLELTYVNNLKSTAAQLRAQGQQAPTDQEIDASVQNLKGSASQGAPAVGGWSVKRVK